MNYIHTIYYCLLLRVAMAATTAVLASVHPVPDAATMWAAQLTYFSHGNVYGLLAGLVVVDCPRSGCWKPVRYLSLGRMVWIWRLGVPRSERSERHFCAFVVTQARQDSSPILHRESLPSPSIARAPRHCR